MKCSTTSLHGCESGRAPVAELSIAVTRAEVTPFSAAPTITFGLQLAEATAAEIHCAVLKVQIRIDPARRRYETHEQESLADLFGDPIRWGDTLRPFLWTEATTVVPAFRDAVEIGLPVACSYDLDVSADRFMHSLDGGVVPLLFLLSGSVFEVAGGRMSVTPIPWHVECRYMLPVEVWRGAVDGHFPGSGWLRLRTDTLDAIGRVKSAQALATWDDAVGYLLVQSGEAGPA